MEVFYVIHISNTHQYFYDANTIIYTDHFNFRMIHIARNTT